MRVLRNIQRRLPSANHIGFDAVEVDARRFDPDGQSQMPMHPVCKPLIIRLSKAEVGEAFRLRQVTRLATQIERISQERRE